MPLLESLIGPIASIIDKVIPDKEARAKAKLELLALEGTQELKQIEARLSAIVAEAQSRDPWTSRARPSFLYVMYALILFSVPMGVIAAFDPGAARAIGEGMTGYLGRPARSALRSLRHRLPRLHRGAPMGQGERRGSVGEIQARAFRDGSPVYFLRNTMIAQFKWPEAAPSTQCPNPILIRSTNASVSPASSCRSSMTSRTLA